MAYRHLSGQQVVPINATTSCATWIAEDALLFYSLRRIYHRQFRVRGLFQQLATPRIYGIFCWNDPWPFLRYMVTVILPTIAKKTFRKLQREAGLS